jgi:hypothetical protein
LCVEGERSAFLSEKLREEVKKRIGGEPKIPLFHYFHIILICMYDVIYEAEIALCNINKQPLQPKARNASFPIAGCCAMVLCIFVCCTKNGDAHLC